MKHLITILFLFFCSLSLQAQYTLPSSQIDVIAYDSKGHFYFYQQKGEDMLLRIIGSNMKHTKLTKAKKPQKPI